MTMQYDVKQGHLNQSGFFVLGRNRVKGVSFFGTGSDATPMEAASSLAISTLISSSWLCSLVVANQGPEWLAQSLARNGAMTRSI